MSDDRIPTHLYVTGHLRQFLATGIDAVVLRKGDPTGGLVLLKLTRSDRDSGFGIAAPTEVTCRVLTQSRDKDGRLAWFAARDGAFIPEGEADSYIERAVHRDPDLWVLEIHSPNAHNPFEGREI